MAVWLVAFKGVPGSGKSTLARALSREVGWPLVDKDDVKDLLDGHAEDTGLLSYTIMFNVARRQLLLGLSVICDSPLTYRSLYERAEGIAAGTGAHLAIIECECSDEEEWRRRIEGRKGMGMPSHHQTDWARLQQYMASIAEESQYDIAAPHLKLDTRRPLEELVSRVVEWLAWQDSLLQHKES